MRTVMNKITFQKATTAYKEIILLFSEKTQAIYGFIKNEESGNEECSM